jgi:hypothetical protein
VSCCSPSFRTLGACLSVAVQECLWHANDHGRQPLGFGTIGNPLGTPLPHRLEPGAQCHAVVDLATALAVVDAPLRRQDAGSHGVTCCATRQRAETEGQGGGDPGQAGSLQPAFASPSQQYVTIGRAGNARRTACAPAPFPRCRSSSRPSSPPWPPRRSLCSRSSPRFSRSWRSASSRKRSAFGIQHSGIAHLAFEEP